jgi:CHAT domain-containing protein
VHLPLHAAELRGVRCSDYIVSSYVPTLGTLINARRKSSCIISKSTAKALVGAVPRPSEGGFGELLATLDEVESVGRVMPERLLIPLPREDDSLARNGNGLRRQTFLEKLPEATILHLACHGVQNTGDPLRSGFVMQDGLLTIDELIPIPLQHAFLAFLSACETAKGDQVSWLSISILFTYIMI